MKYILIAFISLIPVAYSAGQAIVPPTGEDEKQIGNVLANFMTAWNKHDATAFSTLFADDADFTNVVGRGAHGRQEIEKFHAPVFATRFKDSHQTLTKSKTRFIKPDVAAVDAWWDMTGARGPDGQEQPLRKGLLNFVMTKSSNTWLITVMHNMDLPPSP